MWSGNESGSIFLCGGCWDVRPLDFEAGLLLLVPSTPSNATQEQRFLFRTHALATKIITIYFSLYTLYHCTWYDPETGIWQEIYGGGYQRFPVPIILVLILMQSWFEARFRVRFSNYHIYNLILSPVWRLYISITQFWVRDSSDSVLWVSTCRDCIFRRKMHF